MLDSSTLVFVLTTTPIRISNMPKCMICALIPRIVLNLDSLSTERHILYSVAASAIATSGTVISIGVLLKGDTIAKRIDNAIDAPAIIDDFFTSKYPINKHSVRSITSAAVGSADRLLKYWASRLISTPVVSFATRGVNIPIVSNTVSKTNVSTVASIVFFGVTIFSMSVILYSCNIYFKNEIYLYSIIRSPYRYHTNIKVLSEYGQTIIFVSIY